MNVVIHHTDNNHSPSRIPVDNIPVYLFRV